MKKILVCVDCQYDFIEGGNLPVTGARKAMNKLVKYVEKHRDEFAAVVCTLDWHPHGHCSFVPAGGTWPVHCVQHTHGAALYQPLMDVLPKDKLHMFLKGMEMNRDEYSFLDNEKNVKRFERLLKKTKADCIEICGIAGDVCVMNTALSLIALGHQDKISVVMRAVASLDDEVTARFIAEKSLKMIK